MGHLIGFLDPTLFVEGQNLQFDCQIDLAQFNIGWHCQNSRREVQDAANPSVDESVADGLGGFTRRSNNADAGSGAPDGLAQVVYGLHPKRILPDQDRLADRPRITIEDAYQGEPPQREGSIGRQGAAKIAETHEDDAVGHRCTQFAADVKGK
jgi:hypothetical protein